MYALDRNSWKYSDRDKRTDKTQFIEFSFLGPDTINEMTEAITLMEELTGRALLKRGGNHTDSSREELISAGKKFLLKGSKEAEELEIIADGFENSARKVKLLKLPEAYRLFKDLILFHAAEQMLHFMQTNKIVTVQGLTSVLPTKFNRTQWINTGGQLILQAELDKLIKKIISGKSKSWEEVHEFYRQQAKQYALDKFLHSAAALKEVHGIDLKKITIDSFHMLLQQSVATKEWMNNGIYESRAKDYKNEFRKMVYDTTEEMNIVIGDLDKNIFIKQQRVALEEYKKQVQALIRKSKTAGSKAKAIGA